MNIFPGKRNHLANITLVAGFLRRWIEGEWVGVNIKLQNNYFLCNTLHRAEMVLSTQQSSILVNSSSIENIIIENASNITNLLNMA